MLKYVLAISLAVLALSVHVTHTAATTGYLTSNNQQLMLNGQPFGFEGVNKYSLLTVGFPYRGCGASFSDAQMDAAFSEIAAMHGKVVRFWAFQEFTASGTDFSRLDEAVALANTYDLYLMPVLENQWQDCTSGGYKYDTWYASGYASPYGSYPESLTTYIGQIVPRYATEPRIAMWQVMNEAENKTTGGSCGSFSTFDTFAQTTTDLIRSYDANHLISFGTIGSNQCGAENNNGTPSHYQTLHAHTNVNLLEYHDYGADTTPLPSNLAADIAIGRTLNKPIFVGEAGIQAGPGCTALQQRADDFAAKIQAAEAVGYLIWIHHTPNETQPNCSYDFLNSDPLVTTLTNTSDWDTDGYPDVADPSPSTYCKTMRADLNGDGAVNSSDLTLFAHWFSMTAPPAPERYDQNGDRAINSSDLTLFAQQFAHNVSECP